MSTNIDQLRVRIEALEKIVRELHKDVGALVVIAVGKRWWQFWK